MEKKNIAGVDIMFSEDGFFADASQWNREIAAEIAKEDGIILSDDHYAVLEYLRNEHAAGAPLTIRKVGKSGIVDIKGLYKLFPGGPLKLSSKYAGIPKPTSCV
ncbi:MULTISPECIES: TusE/DsrC/DsvC family sulfur relay protein [unclassified Lentimicrobium]|uniref:TusE/DsrC/DsvC family sulfur relay protein n=1 Tax=unclassified Lentimicrobium TaxID=2677434 RepID=UPI00155272F0|nr:MULTISPECIES: TusE/DsrC/DsvC family sulfur relay protein [unclassified Lentimicrobium]NPD47427.1 TusE/DsrC/DsvC family sulfur relay protein [Lentimicrobium sp. S6]NPD85087.1 TusE/DsrC/DsvC family sulfur relay protein [Lentimicrobium sp. L6]